MTKMETKCEYWDPECPHGHKGNGHKGGVRMLYRVDMNDETGILMCDTCQEDAFDSGLFSYEKLILG